MINVPFIIDAAGIAAIFGSFLWFSSQYVGMARRWWTHGTVTRKWSLHRGGIVEGDPQDPIQATAKRGEPVL